jgi:arylsulfatase A-like enzyme
MGGLASWSRGLLVWASSGAALVAALAVCGALAGGVRAGGWIGHGQWFAIAGAIGAAAREWLPVGVALGIVAWAARGLLLPLSPARSGGRGGAGRLALAAGSAAALATALLAGLPALRPRPGSPNIVLIVLDTARRDRFSKGGPRSLTPSFDRLATEGRLFTNATSTSPWTCPSHASLFTGLYPCAHHVTQESWMMSPRLRTLAETLWEEGYRTVALVGNPMLRRGLGFEQGFEEFHEMWRETDFARHQTLGRFEALLDRGGTRPFFAFVNIIEPHNPYNSSRQFFGRSVRHPGLRLVENLWPQVVTGRRRLEAAELEHLNDLYDDEIQFGDYMVGEVASMLRNRGLLDRTVLVVTSDHGENLGEHGLVDHVFSVHETTLRIPMLIRYPPAFPPGGEDPSPVQIHDLFPTILALAERPGDASSQGLDLTKSPPGSITRPVLAEYYYPLQVLSVIGPSFAESPLLAPYKRRLRTIRKGSLKLIQGDDGRGELYDLAADPDEKTDLSGRAEMAKDLAALRAELKGLVRTYSEGHGVPVGEKPGEGGLDEETLRELRSLGYAR